MKLLIISVAIAVLMAFTFLKSDTTGNLIGKDIIQAVYNPPNDAVKQLSPENPKNKTDNVTKKPEAIISEKTAKDPCFNVTCSKPSWKCPDGFLASCSNSCSNGKCSACTPDCSAHQLLNQQTTQSNPQNQQPAQPSCTESWSCSSWSACSNNLQTRACSDSNNCGTQNNKPPELQSCAVEQPTGSPVVKITNVSYLSPEWVEISNIGNVDAELANWTLKDNTTIHIFTFPTFMFQVGAKLKVHTESGTNTQTDLYWGYKSSIWNNNGDEATLKDKSGNVVDKYSY